jgi:hypothetical protein
MELRNCAIVYNAGLVRIARRVVDIYFLELQHYSVGHYTCAGFSLLLTLLVDKEMRSICLFLRCVTDSLDTTLGMNSRNSSLLCS